MMIRFVLLLALLFALSEVRECLTSARQNLRILFCVFAVGFLLYRIPITHIVSVFCFLPPQAFAPHLSFTPRTTVEPLFACRVNAKKEKIKRNRENMRKFKTSGRRGTSRRKIMKKALSTKARQEESEFISKCFITSPAPGEGDSD